MPLEPLLVVSRSLKTCPPPSFDWNGGEDADDAVGEINDDYIELFKQVNAVAAVAYVLTTTEWIYWYVRDRLDVDDAHDFEQFIVAHWFWICDLPRKVPPPVYRRRNRQPPKDPICTGAMRSALDSISDGIMSVRDHNTDINAAFMSQLCEYIFPRQCGFRRMADCRAPAAGRALSR